MAERRLRDFARDQERRGLQPLTILKRHNILNAFERWLNQTAGTLTTATRDDVERWLDSCRLNARSRATYLSNVHAFYDWAIEAEVCSEDPTGRIHRPRTGRLVPRPISEDDLAVAVRNADTRMRVMLLLAAHQGLRCVEIANLCREDVLDIAEEPVLVVRHGKGGHQRVLPLQSETTQALYRYGMPRAGHLFTVAGRPVQPATVSRAGNAYLRELGINATMHQLRHRFGTRFYQLSLDLRLTQEVMGHADPKTSAIYTAFAPGKAAEVMSKLNLRSVQAAEGSRWTGGRSEGVPPCANRPSGSLQLRDP